MYSPGRERETVTDAQTKWPAFNNFIAFSWICLCIYDLSEFTLVLLFSNNITEHVYRAKTPGLWQEDDINVISVWKKRGKNRIYWWTNADRFCESKYDDSMRDYTTLTADKVSGESNVILIVFLCFFLYFATVGKSSTHRGKIFPMPQTTHRWVENNLLSHHCLTVFFWWILDQ